jgi:3-oxoadipate enol-lactonase
LEKIVRACFSVDANTELVQRAHADIEKTAPDVALADFRTCASFNVCSSLSTLKMPALVCCGSEDVITPPDLSEKLASLIAGARLELIPSGSHMVMLEQPDVFNQILMNFIRQ